MFSGKFKGMGALVASLVVVMGLAACGGDSASGGKSNSDLLKEAVKNMRELKTYRIDATVTSAGEETKIKGDADISANKHNLEITTQGTEMNVVNVGEDYWFSTDGGQNFTQVPEGQQGLFAVSFTQFDEMWAKTTDAEIDKAKDELKDGSPATEKIDNVDTKHMTASMSALASLGSSTGNEGGTVEGTADLWVDTGTPYVRRMTIDGKSAGEDIKADFKWSDFNSTDIKIEPPK